MTEEWRRVAGDAYVRALVAKYKAEAGKGVRTYDADCMAAAIAAVAPMIAAAEREACAKVAYNNGALFAAAAIRARGTNG